MQCLRGVLWCSWTRFRVEAELPGEAFSRSFPEEDEEDAGQGRVLQLQTDQRHRRGWTTVTHARVQGRVSEPGTIIIPIQQMETLRHRVVLEVTQQVCGIAVSQGSGSRVHALNYIRPDVRLWPWEDEQEGPAHNPHLTG